MQISMAELTVNFAHLDRERLLDDWRWLTGPWKQPILLTAIGDVFLQDTEDGTVAFLDVATAELSLVADDLESFRTQLTDPTFVTTYFAVNVVADLRANGLILGAGQIYSWRQPPVLGGEYAFDNATVCDIEVHFSIAGQIHQRVRDVPEGTPVDGISTKNAMPLTGPHSVVASTTVLTLRAPLGPSA